MIKLDERKSKGTHWVPLFIHKNAAAYFDSFVREYIPQEVLNKINQLLTIHLECKKMNLFLLILLYRFH